MCLKYTCIYNILIDILVHKIRLISILSSFYYNLDIYFLKIKDLFIYFYRLILEGGEEREKHHFVVPIIYEFIG